MSLFNERNHLYIADAVRDTDDKVDTPDSHTGYNNLQREERESKDISSRATLRTGRFLHDFGSGILLAQELPHLFLDDFDRGEIRERHRTRLHIRHMPRMPALVLRNPSLEDAGLRTMRFHLADIRAVRLFPFDIGLAQSHIRGDISGGSLGGFRSTEEFEETATSSFKHQETGSAHAVGVFLHAPGGDILELVARGIEVLDDPGRLVAHIESLGTAGQRNDIDLGTELHDLLVGFGNPVITGRNQTFIDRVALGKQLESPKKLGVPREGLELFVGSNLGRR